MKMNERFPIFINVGSNSFKMENLKFPKLNSREEHPMFDRKSSLNVLLFGVFFAIVVDFS